MAELSVDEAQRLARLFLTGKAEAADVQRLRTALDDDQGLALELLAQMQSALDDSAPAGLTAEQDRSVNGRIEALIAPRIKKRGPFSFFLRFFKRKPKEEEAPKNSRLRRRGGATTEAVAEPAAPTPEAGADELSETLPGDGMEEMMPGATATTVEETRPAAPVEEGAAAKPKKEKKPVARPAWLLPVLAGLLLLAGIGAGAWWWQGRRPSVAPVPKQNPAAQVTPQNIPTAVPTVAGQAHRARSIAGNAQEALPAEIRATTPVAAGASNIEP